jgi:glycerophosphoryl diester phosphodiesterase
MRRLFLRIILFAATPIVAFGQQHVDQIIAQFRDSESKIVLVASHRASHLDYPENSLPAIQHAIEIGVDIVELDVKVTKDGVPVLMHDGTINRTTTGIGKPSDYTLEELRKFRLKHKGVVTKETIPTFDEALKLVKGKAMVDIDLKTDQLDPIIEVVKKNGCESQVFFFDSDYNALQYVREKGEEFMLMPRAYSLQMADSAITRFKPEVVHVDFNFYNESTEKLIKSGNARIWINALDAYDPAFGTAKESEALEKLLKFGANVIQTDQPQLLIKALQIKGLHP